MSSQQRNDELIRLLKSEYGGVGSGAGAVTEGPGIDIAGTAVGLGGDTILQYFRALTPVAEFDADLAGLLAAIAAANVRDVLLLPSVDITGDVDFSAGPANLTVVGMGVQATRILGQVTYGSETWLRQLTVRHEDSIAGTLVGLINPPASGHVGFAERCAFKAVNNGAGDAYAVDMQNSGDISHSNCDHQGLALGGGDGYGIAEGSGNAAIHFGRLRGTTESIKET